MDDMYERARQRLAAIHCELHATGSRIGDLAPASCPACWDLMRYVSATQARCTHCGTLLELPAPREVGEGRSARTEGLTEHIHAHWEQIRQRCQTRSPMIAALLNSATPGAVVMTEQHGYELICEVEYRYHLQRLQTPEVQAIVAWAVQETLGAPYGVQFVAKRPALQTGLQARNAPSMHGRKAC